MLRHQFQKVLIRNRKLNVWWSGKSDHSLWNWQYQGLKIDGYIIYLFIWGSFCMSTIAIYLNTTELKWLFMYVFFSKRGVWFGGWNWICSISLAKYFNFISWEFCSLFYLLHHNAMYFKVNWQISLVVKFKKYIFTCQFCLRPMFAHFASRCNF